MVTPASRLLFFDLFIFSSLPVTVPYVSLHLSSAGRRDDGGRSTGVIKVWALVDGRIA
jgi:hypothetical protein